MNRLGDIGIRLVLAVGGLAAGIGLLAVAELALRRMHVDDRPGLFTPEVTSDGSRIMRLSWNPQRNIPQPVQEQRHFLAEKPPGTFRIFVVGESSAEGVPYGTGYAFSSWLARRLEAEVPEIHWEVVNAALAGAQSASMLVMVRDIAKHAPDLLVVYLGHNEVGGRLTAAQRATLVPPQRDLRAWLSRSRLYRLLAGLLPEQAKRLDLRDADRLDYNIVRPGRFHASDADRRAIGRMYGARIAEMVRIMRSVGARTALLTLSQNFSDWPPNISVHRPGLLPFLKAAWRAAVRRGDALAPTNCREAVVAYRQALALDPRFALVHYKLAGCERRLGHLDEASAQFRLASDLDRFSQGAPLALNAILRDVAEREGAILVDVDAALSRASGERLVGDDLFVDPMHPNLRAHQLIAQAVADRLRELGVPVPGSRWRTDAYVDPDAAAIVTADRQLRAREKLTRALTCYSAGRRDCGRQQLEEAKLTTTDPVTRQVIEQGLRTDPDPRALNR